MYATNYSISNNSARHRRGQSLGMNSTYGHGSFMNGHQGILESQEDDYEEHEEGEVMRNTRVRFHNLGESQSVQASPMR